MQANPHSHWRTVHHPADLSCCEPFALGQEQEFAVARTEHREGLAHLPGEWFFLGLLDGNRLTVQLLVQLAPASVRPTLVRYDPSCGRVQPRSSRLASGYVVQPSPRDQEHLGHRVFCIAAGSQAPAAVRGDARNVLSEQRLEALPSHVYLGQIDLLAGLRTHAVDVHTRNKRFSVLLAMTKAHDDTEPSHFCGKGVTQPAIGEFLVSRTGESRGMTGFRAAREWLNRPLASPPVAQPVTLTMEVLYQLS